MSAKQFNLPPEELAKLGEILHKSGKTLDEVALHLNTSRRTLSRAFALTGYDPGFKPPMAPPKQDETKTYYKVLEELHIVDEEVAIMSDVHLPTTRWDWVNEFFRHCVHFGIKKLIINGDLFDESSMNRHEKEFEESQKFEFEMDTGNLFIHQALGIFDEIVIVRGNHDVNFVRNLNHQMSFQRSMRMLLHKISEEDHERITIVDCDSCYVHNDMGLDSWSSSPPLRDW
jgi:predicted phosphodiesterase